MNTWLNSEVLTHGHVLVQVRGSRWRFKWFVKQALIKIPVPGNLFVNVRHESLGVFSAAQSLSYRVFPGREQRRGPRGKPQLCSGFSLPHSSVWKGALHEKRWSTPRRPQQLNPTARKSEAVFAETDTVKNEQGKAEGRPSSLYWTVWKNHFRFTHTVVMCKSLDLRPDVFFFSENSCTVRL